VSERCIGSVKDLFTVTLWGMKLSMHMQKKGRCFREGIDIVMPPDQDPVLFKFAPGFAKQLEEPIQVRDLKRAYNTLDPKPWIPQRFRISALFPQVK